jgi:transcription elongation GreA/GreB family factor
MKNDEKTPKYVVYFENKLQEMKTIERKQISKVDAKQTRYGELSPNLEPKVNDIQMS